MTDTPPVTGRCYCGVVHFSAATAPRVVSYCHCWDCRRVTGAPVAAFAAFDDAALRYDPDLGAPASHAPGVQRWFCGACGSPLAARFDYLAGQTYVPLGLIDQAGDLPPSLHSHSDSKLPWLQIDDELHRQEGSARDTLRGAGSSE